MSRTKPHSIFKQEAIRTKPSKGRRKSLEDHIKNAISSIHIIADNIRREEEILQPGSNDDISLARSFQVFSW